MGMHFALIAAKAPLSDFRAAFSETWPKLEVTTSQEGFASAEDIWAWRNAHERFVSATDWTNENRGSKVYVFCQDGPWAVLMDFSYVLAGDEEALQKLSSRFSSTLSFIVETAGGCAYFWYYEAGQLRRMIQNIDGETVSSGSALPQEKNIDVEAYYMDEAAQLLQAFGLSKPEDLPVASTAVAIATIDRTDYSQLVASISGRNTDPQESSSQGPKPWWKFW
jgi:hypothetical protein